MIDPVVTAELRWQREQDQMAAEYDDSEDELMNELATDEAYLRWATALDAFHPEDCACPFCHPPRTLLTAKK